jgi:hypothetical protein
MWGTHRPNPYLAAAVTAAFYKETNMSKCSECGCTTCKCCSCCGNHPCTCDDDDNKPSIGILGGVLDLVVGLGTLGTVRLD